MRVLVVDDDRDVAESLGMVIEGLGYAVELAFDGDQAIDRCRQEQFDLTLMDVRMPGKNGVEAFLELRRLRPEIKVMMMTGHSVEELLERALSHGALGVLRKPIDLNKLREVLAGL